MKTIYRCEICHSDYASAERAIACESQAPLAGPPKGLILTMHYLDEPNKFAALCTGEMAVSRHWHRPLVYWFRGNGCGDDDTPRSDVIECRNWSAVPDTDTEAESYKRALVKCASLGWDAMILVNRKVCALPIPSVKKGSK